MCFAFPAIMNVKCCCLRGSHTEVEDLRMKNLTLGTKRGGKRVSFLVWVIYKHHCLSLKSWAE